MRTGKSSVKLTGHRRGGGDANLGLGFPGAHIAPDNASNSGIRDATIVVDDDDEEVQVVSPVAKAMLSTSTRQRTLYIPVLDDEDLELRLGLAGTTLSTQRKSLSRVARMSVKETNFGLSLNAAIDLTSSTNDHLDLSKIKGKRKQIQEETVEPSKEVKLTCAICMDVMKEETSTICGHLFCKICIMGALKVQKKCPACRRKLTNNQIHRIFITGSTN